MAFTTPQGRTQTSLSEINITPFVDVVLVLLIIFMVTAKLVLNPATAMSIQLPKASKADKVQTVFAISLLKDGSQRVNGKPADDASLLAAAREQRAKHPDLKTVIQADGDVPHRQVIHVMDLLSQAQLTQIAFSVQVDPKLAPAPPSP